MKLIEFVVVAAVALFLFGGGWSIVSNYTSLSGRVATAEHQVFLDTGRLASYKRMVDRRDAAIAQSKCKTQITGWVDHPETLPPPFKPFSSDTK